MIRDISINLKKQKIIHRNKQKTKTKQKHKMYKNKRYDIFCLLIRSRKYIR